MGFTEPLGICPAGVLIRAAALDDIGEITAIYRQAVLEGTGTFEIEPPDAAEMAARHARIVAGGYPYLVAQIGEDVVGFAYAFAYRDRPAYRFTVEDSVYVRGDRQGRGFGRALIEALIGATTAAGFRQMVAVIGDSDNAGSIALHARAGFAHAGVLRASGWKAGRWLDVVLMQRQLGDGNSMPP